MRAERHPWALHPPWGSHKLCSPLEGPPQGQVLAKPPCPPQGAGDSAWLCPHGQVTAGPRVPSGGMEAPRRGCCPALHGEERARTAQPSSSWRKQCPGHASRVRPRKYGRKEVLPPPPISFAIWLRPAPLTRLADAQGKPAGFLSLAEADFLPSEPGFGPRNLPAPPADRSGDHGRGRGSSPGLVASGGLVALESSCPTRTRLGAGDSPGFLCLAREKPTRRLPQPPLPVLLGGPGKPSVAFKGASRCP